MDKLAKIKTMPEKKIQLVSLTALILLGMIQTNVRGNTRFIEIPTEKEIYEIQIQAYDCSIKNTQLPCNKAMEMINPLMDNPRLTSACKDTVWQLLHSLKKSSTNDFYRKDSIEIPAKKLSSLCIRQKKREPKKLFRRNRENETQT